MKNIAVRVYHNLTSEANDDNLYFIYNCFFICRSWNIIGGIHCTYILLYIRNSLTTYKINYTHVIVISSNRKYIYRWQQWILRTFFDIESQNVLHSWDLSWYISYIWRTRTSSIYSCQTSYIVSCNHRDVIQLKV